jgi:hypothetical protein
MPGLDTLHRCFLPSLAPFGQAVSEEKIFLTVANQKQELPLEAIFVGGTEVPGCVPFKIVADSPTLHSRWLLFFKVMIISL